MSDPLYLFITLAQFIFMLWPLFIILVLFYSLQGSGNRTTGSRRARITRGLKNTGLRVLRNLLITWTLLFALWIVTWFADGPTPGLLPDPWNGLIFTGGWILLLLIEASRLGLFRRRLLAHLEMEHANSLRQLEGMDPYDFERLITETYRANGYKAQHIGHSGDHGIDVEVRTNSGDLWIVQCKRYRGSVGESIIRDLYGTMISEKADRAVLATTAEITTPARAWARGKPIDLLDGQAVLRFIDQGRRRSAGTLLHRLALWLEGILGPEAAAAFARSIEPARPHSIAADPLAATQPVHAPHPNGGSSGGQVEIVPAVQYYLGTPICPHCGIPMRPRPPQPHDGADRPLFRCVNYPTCRVVLEAQPEQP